MASSLRDYIDLIEGERRIWESTASDLFDESLERHVKTFPDLKEKVVRFLQLKLEDPLTRRYGQYDRPFTGPLIGFSHCHLKEDALLIYNLKNRRLNLIIIVTHDQIEGKRGKQMKKHLAAYL